jgi:hypothetical protein
MGWCGGTEIFDEVVGYALQAMPTAKQFEIFGLIKATILVLEDKDWDCQCDSMYYDHPLVRKAFQEVNDDYENRHTQ